jgi:plastocyanin
MKYLLTAVLLLPVAGIAADADVTLTIRDHRFQPAELIVPAGKKIKLTVVNEDSTAEEFESHALNREKVIPANSSTTIYIGPLSPGRYSFVGEFHEQTAQGTVVAQ